MSAAARVVGHAAKRVASTTATKRGGEQGEKFLKQGARRDPELYILGGIMAGAFGLAGFYFGRKPTAASSEADIHMAHGSMPWQVDDSKDGADANFKYQYHPRGDKSAAPKNAPSALNTVIIPNVELPKEFHEKFNKWGKEGFD